ncbi:MAG: class I SAM-dependent methyltransferase [Kineosporiaceae bacterium]
MTVTLGATTPPALRRHGRGDAARPVLRGPATPLTPVSPPRVRRSAAPACAWCAGDRGPSGTEQVEFGWYSAVLSRVLETVDPRVAAAHGVPDATAEQLRWAATCRGTGDRPVLDLVARAVAQAPGGDGLGLVDVGAGTGGPSAYLATRTGLPVLAVEPSRQSLATARRLFGDVEGVRVVEGDAAALPAPDGSAAAVTMLGLLSLLPDASPALREARRVAAPGAVLALTDYTAPSHGARRAADLPEGTRPDVTGELLTALDAAGWDVEHVVDGALLPDRVWLGCRDVVDAAIARHVALTPHGLDNACPAAHEAEMAARAQFSGAIEAGTVRRLTVVARAR